MSHFTVTVIGDSPEDQLQPFHEYECTGVLDEHVVFVDLTEEVEADWERGYPDWSASQEEYGKPPFKEQYADIDEFAREWNGYERNDQGRFGRMTNPNAKWDWFQLGGRWRGSLKLKDGADGVVGAGGGLCDTQAEDGWADRAYLRDIDIEGMRDRAGEDAGAEYDKVIAAYGGVPEVPALTFEQCCEAASNNYDAARTTFWGQPEMVKWKAVKAEMRFWSATPEDFAITREEYVQRAQDGALSSYAVVKDSKWYERGEMGWWGMASNEKDKGEWDKEFASLIDGLDPSTVISVYDCHI